VTGKTALLLIGLKKLKGTVDRIHITKWKHYFEWTGTSGACHGFVV